MGQWPAAQRLGVNISAGTLQAQTGTAVMSNANGISFGMQLSASSYVVTASMDAFRSIIAGSNTVTGSLVAFLGSNGISFGATGQTLTAGLSRVSYFDAPGDRNAVIPAFSTTTAGGTAFSISFQRFSVPFPISATQIDILRHLTVAGSTAGSFTLWYGFYTSITGSQFAFWNSTSTGVTFNSGTNSTASSIYGGESGTRFQSCTLTTWVFSPGEYLMAFNVSMAGVAGTTGSMSVFGNSSVSIVGNIGGVATNAYFGYGVSQTSASASTGIPLVPAGAFGTIALSNITETGAAVLGQPYFRLIGI